MYCQINEHKRIKALMILIGKEALIPAFEKNLGIPWKQAKMSKFYAFGLGLKDNKGVLYYKDGITPYGTLVIECSIDYIKQVRENL